MKKIQLFCAANSKGMEDSATQVMRSGMIAGGSYVSKFENGLSKILKVKHIVTVSDMTSAITLIFRLLDIKQGDDILTTSFSCMASNAPIALAKANPVWVDVLKDSVCVDPISFERAITPKTKAAIIYHVAGYPSDVEEIARICKKHGIVLIEDCNNAMMATLNNQHLGSFGDFGVFSFYPTRLLQTFEGAAISCRNTSAVKQLQKMRRLGIDNETFRNKDGEISAESDIPKVGFAATLNNLSSAVGFAQLGEILDKVALIRKNAQLLSKGIEGIQGVSCIKPLEGSDPSYWTFLLLVEHRDALLRFMKSKGVHVSALHSLNHRYSCFPQENEVSLPNSEYIQEHILAIPCGWWLTKEDIEYIIQTVHLGVREYG